MAGNKEPKEPVDFEEVTRVTKIDQSTWEGVYPLRLPIGGARGVYGGHICAQTLLVAMESAPGFVPHSFHSHFVKAGNPILKCVFKVTSLDCGGNTCKRHILLIQNGLVIYTAICSLVKANSTSKLNSSDEDFMHVKPAYPKKDSKPVYKTYHTDFIVNAYTDEFLKYETCPAEARLSPSERWITLRSKLHQPKKTKFKDLKFNYVGLAHLSDAAVLTTLARALHLEWNPTIDNTQEEFDESRDARDLINTSLNIMHLYHYTAMSLDHHIYFHLDDYTSFNVIKDWLYLRYQYLISRNSRTLVRGHFFNNDGKCVATFVQEGLTHWRPGVPGSIGRKFSNL